MDLLLIENSLNRMILSLLSRFIFKLFSGDFNSSAILTVTPHQNLWSVISGPSIYNPAYSWLIYFFETNNQWEKDSSSYRCCWRPSSYWSIRWFTPYTATNVCSIKSCVVKLCSQFVTFVKLWFFRFELWKLLKNLIFEKKF